MPACTPRSIDWEPPLDRLAPHSSVRARLLGSWAMWTSRSVGQSIDSKRLVWSPFYQVSARPRQRLLLRRGCSGCGCDMTRSTHALINPNPHQHQIERQEAGVSGRGANAAVRIGSFKMAASSASTAAAASGGGRRSSSNDYVRVLCNPTARLVDMSLIAAPIPTPHSGPRCSGSSSRA